MKKGGDKYGKKSGRGGPEMAGAIGRIVGGSVVANVEARAVENRGKGGGREEGWRVVMMDALLSFSAP